MTTHSSIFAWETLGTEEPGGLQCMGSQSGTQPSTHTLALISYPVCLDLGKAVPCTFFWGALPSRMQTDLCKTFPHCPICLTSKVK